jgi:hypothetical protein
MLNPEEKCSIYNYYSVVKRFEEITGWNFLNGWTALSVDNVNFKVSLPEGTHQHEQDFMIKVYPTNEDFSVKSLEDVLKMGELKIYNEKKYYIIPFICIVDYLVLVHELPYECLIITN